MRKPRAGDLGLDFPGTTGPDNAITDVPGVLVGFSTIIQGNLKRACIIHRFRQNGADIDVTRQRA